MAADRHVRGSQFTALHAIEETPQPVQRQQHQVMQAQARQGFELIARPLYTDRNEALRGR